MREPLPRRVRWGEPERERLNAMLGQDSLFYWKAPQTTLLIERFQKICPLRHVMTCSSGTAALHIAVAAAGIGPGDEVITSPITDIGTVIGTLYQQAVPVFADLGRNTYNLDPDDVAKRITPKTKAIIAVHLGGNPCDMDALKSLADRHGLVLIEDCAQAWGRSIAESRSARSDTSPAFRFKIPSRSPAETAAWWRPVMSGSGRCCSGSATRDTTGWASAASSRSSPRTTG